MIFFQWPVCTILNMPIEKKKKKQSAHVARNANCMTLWAVIRAIGGLTLWTSACRGLETHRVGVQCDALPHRKWCYLRFTYQLYIIYTWWWWKLLSAPLSKTACWSMLWPAVYMTMTWQFAPLPVPERRFLICASLWALFVFSFLFFFSLLHQMWRSKKRVLHL